MIKNCQYTAVGCVGWCGCMLPAYTLRAYSTYHMVWACWVNKIHMQLLTLECPRESFWLLQKIMYTFSNSIIFLGYHSLVTFNINIYIFICYHQNLPKFLFSDSMSNYNKMPIGSHFDSFLFSTQYNIFQRNNFI